MTNKRKMAQSSVGGSFSRREQPLPTSGMFRPSLACSFDSGAVDSVLQGILHALQHSGSHNRERTSPKSGGSPSLPTRRCSARGASRPPTTAPFFQNEDGNGSRGVQRLRPKSGRWRVRSAHTIVRRNRRLRRSPPWNQEQDCSSDSSCRGRREHSEASAVSVAPTVI